MTSRVGIGIDVSKDKVDVAASDGSWRMTYLQQPRSLQALARKVARHEPHRVVVEATGGYERQVLRALHAARAPVVLVQPGRARAFARALGQLAKTDRIDAEVLARMALMAVDDTVLWEPLAPRLERLEGLVKRRQQLVAMVDMERKRLRGAPEDIVEHIEATLAFFKSQIRDIEKRIDAQLAEDEQLFALASELERVQGVGRVTAATLVVLMPELGTLNRRQVAALAGLAPMNHDSGRHRGQRHIRGGRARVRVALYMATLSAIRHNPHIRQHYARLRSNGKLAKVALTACMRKLLVHLNSRVRAVGCAAAVRPTPSA
jgi:transposase